MSIPKHVEKHLAKHQAKYVHVPHRTVFTAYDAAQTLRRKLDEIAKNVLVKTDDGLALVIIPASKNIDFNKLKQTMKKAGARVKKIKIPNEKEITKALGIKPGTLSAFGSLHELKTYMDKGFAKAKKVIFSSGSVEDSVEMAVVEFAKLENAILGSFTVPKKLPKQVKVVIKKTKAKKLAKKTARKSKKRK